MAYLPIQDHGIVGNRHTAALVGLDGTIDWLCYPRFDSPSVFAAILDDKKGGRFAICPAVGNVTTRQFYWPDSNVLTTRFLTPDGVGQVMDYMPVGVRRGEPGHHWLIRQVEVVRGTMAFEMECCPAFDYARAAHDVTLNGDGACFRSQHLGLGLLSKVPLRREGTGVRAQFVLEENQTATFILRELLPDGSWGVCPSDEDVFALFWRTVEFWRHWLSRCTYQGRWREAVHRSALALKLLTYEPSGAIIAAPTASLPEHVGGGRNWDYRYTWIRDAALTLYGLLRIGFTEEAVQFMHFLEDRCREPDPDRFIQLVYGIDGRHELPEETLDHLDGYRGSRPVRIGNAAYGQLQLDIYGELMESVFHFNKYGNAISYDLWTRLRELVNWVCDNWHREDEGIWEMRSGRKHFVHSKLMCWVALDRGLRLADDRSFPADRSRWIEVRDAIFEDIINKGWNEKRQAFVQHYGSDALDAANLMMPLVDYLAATDPRILSTIDATCKPPKTGGLVSNSLVYRYNTADGLAGSEGTFNMCTFWLVEALTRAGRLDDARLMFEEMLGYANHLRLYAEETGPSGEALGNFPQAFTHLSLISSAFDLDRALGERA
ncbi:MAG: glycoside hydrolase family 15 protein [Gemmatimonadales bacterium]